MKKWAVLILMSSATLIIVIDTTIMNVSISDLVADLGTTVGGIQSAISLYALVMAAFMLTGGKLGEIIGTRLTFTIGLVVFGVGTTIASFSQNLAMLIIGWSVLEGLGSALMMPNIQTVLRSRYEGSDRALSYGVVSAVAAVGAALGPIVGGAFTTYASWRWAFRLEVLIVIAVLIFIGALPKDRLSAARPRFDFAGATLAAGGFALVVLGVLFIQDYGLLVAKQPLEVAGAEIAPFGISVVPFIVGIGALLVLGLFVYERGREARSDPGLFRPSLLKTPGLLPGLTVRLIQYAVMAATLFTIPLLFQLTFEYTAIQTGVAMLPFSFGVLVLAVGGARLSAKLEARRMIQVGFIVAVAGLGALLASVQPDVSSAEIATGALLGAGIGLISSQILNLVLSRVSAADTAEIAGVNGTFEQLGNALGVALVGTVMIVTVSQGVAEGVGASDAIPGEIKAEVVAAAEAGVQLLSDTDLDTVLTDAGIGSETRAEIEEIYADERTRGFRAAVIFLMFISVGGLLVALMLPRGKLVGGGDDDQTHETGLPGAPPSAMAD